MSSSAYPLSRRGFLIRTAGVASGAVAIGSGARSLFAQASSTRAPDRLQTLFTHPPLEARPGAYWVWTDGYFNLDQITRELQDFLDKGLSGVEFFDVGARDPDNIVPDGPPFMGPAAVKAVGHAVREATRLGLEMGLITSSSWNAGGPWVSPAMASKALYASEVQVTGPGRQVLEMPKPEVPQPLFQGRGGGTDPWNGQEPFSQEIALLAIPTADDRILRDISSVIDLSAEGAEAGRLEWNVPVGDWTLLRVVCANNRERLRLPSPNSDGYMIDHLDGQATESHFLTIIERLRAELGRISETALKYLYLPSYEVRGLTEWTPSFRAEFLERRGYDVLPFLPLLFGWRLANVAIADRFDHDRRLTVSDLLVENHYGRAAEVCHRFGLKLHAEAGGPGKPFHPTHDFPAEALRALGVVDVPRGEFWVRQPPGQNDTANVIKEIACAIHGYGKRLAEMESFTGFDHWMRGPSDLKPYADRVFCEGANRIVFHTLPHHPPEAGEPGWSYHAGTHMGLSRVWWPMAKPFISYLSRCSTLLQEGQFVGDVCFYYGHDAPNLVANKRFDERAATLGPGYDYDYCNTDILLNRMTVEQGQLTLPDGLQYAVLVLPDREDMHLDVFKKLEELVRLGATIVGLKPKRAAGLGTTDSEELRQRDEAIAQLANRMWADVDGERIRRRAYGEGQILAGIPLRQVMKELNRPPDFSFAGRDPSTELDYIHRRVGDDEIYFVCNTRDRWDSVDATFRVTDRSPELWSPDSGQRRLLLTYDAVEGGTRIHLDLPPYGAAFVVFRKASPPIKLQVVSIRNDQTSIFPVTAGAEDGEPAVQIESEPDGVSACILRQPGPYEIQWADGSRRRIRVTEPPSHYSLQGSWTVQFPDRSGTDWVVEFPALVWWTDHDEERIRHFSGIATYTKTFLLPNELFDPMHRLVLDLGKLFAVADVQLNGRPLGILWKQPWRCHVSEIATPGENHLSIQIGNVWANRLVGDRNQPKEQRQSTSNLPQSALPTELVPSGLLGPVQFRQELVIPL